MAAAQFVKRVQAQRQRKLSAPRSENSPFDYDSSVGQCEVVHYEN